MPIHDWTRVEAGAYHEFHQDWAIEIKRTLNRGVLPPGYRAMTEHRVLGLEPDVIAIQTRPSPVPGGVAVVESPPRVRQSARAETDRAVYARRANQIVIRHPRGQVVAMLEIVSPGNKDGRRAVTAFTEKVGEFLRNRVHVLVIDLFPPPPRDPEGIHRLIWDEVAGGPFEARPSDKPLTVASYDAGPDLTAYVDPLAVGDELPDAPLFLAPGWYINVPLEQAYRVSWAELSDSIRNDLEPPA